MARKYTGKYPNRISMVASANGNTRIKTNAGALLHFTSEQSREAFGYDMPKLGADVTHLLQARGIATRDGVLAEANAAMWRLIYSHAPRFNIGEPARVWFVGGAQEIPVVITAREDISAEGNWTYSAKDANGNTYTVTQGQLKPAQRHLVAQGREFGVGAGQWNASARDMLSWLGVSKLPDEAMAPRWIQGHMVYVISAKQARDIGEFHRVRMECHDCGEHVPFGRMHQHKCK